MARLVRTGRSTGGRLRCRFLRRTPAGRGRMRGRAIGARMRRPLARPRRQLSGLSRSRPPSMRRCHRVVRSRAPLRPVVRPVPTGRRRSSPSVAASLGGFRARWRQGLPRTARSRPGRPGRRRDCGTSARSRGPCHPRGDVSAHGYHGRPLAPARGLPAAERLTSPLSGARRPRSLGNSARRLTT